MCFRRGGAVSSRSRAFVFAMGWGRDAASSRSNTCRRRPTVGCSPTPMPSAARLACVRACVRTHLEDGARGRHEVDVRRLDRVLLVGLVERRRRQRVELPPTPSREVRAAERAPSSRDRAAVRTSERGGDGAVARSSVWRSEVGRRHGRSTESRGDELSNQCGDAPSPSECRDLERSQRRDPDATRAVAARERAPEGRTDAP